jgi:hypothetical protein
MSLTGWEKIKEREGVPAVGSRVVISPETKGVSFSLG